MTTESGYKGWHLYWRSKNWLLRYTCLFKGFPCDPHKQQTKVGDCAYKWLFLVLQLRPFHFNGNELRYQAQPPIWILHSAFCQQQTVHGAPCSCLSGNWQWSWDRDPSDLKDRPSVFKSHVYNLFNDSTKQPYKLPFGRSPLHVIKSKCWLNSRPSFI